jgi:hypothetical protein
MQKRERKQGKHQCLPDTHFKSMLRPWLPKCNRSLEPFPNPDWVSSTYSSHRLLHSPALGEIAVVDHDRISFWRMSHGGKVIKFVARIQVQGGGPACYAGTCLFLFRLSCREKAVTMMSRHDGALQDSYSFRVQHSLSCREKAVTMMSRHDGALQDSYSFRVQHSVWDIQGGGDVFALLSCGGHATVYQQRAVREFVVLYRIAIGQFGQSVLTICPFVCFVRGWQTTICNGYRDSWDNELQKCTSSFCIYRTWSCTNGFDTHRSRDYVEELPRKPAHFTKRRVVWVHDCMGVLSILDVLFPDVGKGSLWRPRFMFSCDSDQYAFTHNVSDVKQAWMGACVQ